MRTIGHATLALLLLSTVASCDSSEKKSAADVADVTADEADIAGGGDCHGVFAPDEPTQVIAALRLCPGPMAGFPGGFSEIHGTVAAYLYSDGTLAYRDLHEQGSGPTLPFKKISVNGDQYCALVGEVTTAGLEQEAGSGYVGLTEATDLPDTEVFLRSGDEEILVSMYGDLFYEKDVLAADYESMAPNAIALARGLKELSAGGEVFESESIQIATAVLSDDNYSEHCPVTEAVEWPFADVPLADHAFEWESQPVVPLTITGQKAQDVRDWWVTQAESPPCSRVFVNIDGAAHEVFLAEVPPGGPDAMPFAPCIDAGM